MRKNNKAMNPYRKGNKLGYSRYNMIPGENHFKFQFKFRVFFVFFIKWALFERKQSFVVLCNYFSLISNIECF